MTAGSDMLRARRVGTTVAAMVMAKVTRTAPTKIPYGGTNANTNLCVIGKPRASSPTAPAVMTSARIVAVTEMMTASKRGTSNR